jgi:hypothetical protein
MLLLNSIEPERWYTVREVARILGWSEDAVYDWVHAGLLEAFIKPITSPRRPRIWMGQRIQGCEIIRFVKANLSTLSTKIRHQRH